jgi:hypothetical protein
MNYSVHSLCSIFNRHITSHFMDSAIWYVIVLIFGVWFWYQVRFYKGFRFIIVFPNLKKKQRILTFVESFSLSISSKFLGFQLLKTNANLLVNSGSLNSFIFFVCTFFKRVFHVLLSNGVLTLRFDYLQILIV